LAHRLDNRRDIGVGIAQKISGLLASSCRPEQRTTLIVATVQEDRCAVMSPKRLARIDNILAYRSETCRLYAPKANCSDRVASSQRAQLVHGCIPLESIALDVPDPLLALLRRYQAELKAFDDSAAPDGVTEADWDRIAQDTWAATQDEIIQSEPPATTAAGALLALDHALQSDYLFADRPESRDLQMLWHLIKAARDYIASTENRILLLRQ
jgi:hypothetical protein